jgi:phage/plasmid-associated DNA primase
LVGYIIQPRRHLPIIPILFGRGDNGKTRLMRTVMQLLGPALVHAQRVEDLDKSRFAMGSLCGKLLFVDDDVRAGARLPDGILKTISEGKQVTGELKFGPTFNFVVRAMPVLLCNNIPCLADFSQQVFAARVQYTCRYLVISIFSGSVPTAVEKSMNFWNSALCLSVSSPAMK